MNFPINSCEPRKCLMQRCNFKIICGHWSWPSHVCTQSLPAVKDQAAEQVMPPCGALTAKWGQLTGTVPKEGDNMERRAKFGEEALGGWAAASQASSYCAQKQKEFDIWPLLEEKPKQHLQSRQWSMEVLCPHNKEQMNQDTLDKQINRGFLGVSGKALKIHALRNSAQISCEKFWNITETALKLSTFTALFRVLWLTSP